jgi:hypothetical protein
MGLAFAMGSGTAISNTTALDFRSDTGSFNQTGMAVLIETLGSTTPFENWCYYVGNQVSQRSRK